MRATTLFLLFCCLLFLFLVSTSVGQRRRKNRGRGGRGGPNCHLKDVERCLEPLTALGKRDNATAIIATSEGLDLFCQTVKTKFNGCVRDYFKKCGTPLHREVSGLVLDQVLSHTRDLCTRGPKREKFLKSSPCLHQKALSSRVMRDECNNRYVSTLNRASVTRNDTLSAICCGFRFWEDCASKLSRDHCGEGGVEAFRFLVSKGFMDLPNLSCPQDLFRPASAECLAVVAPKGGKSVRLNVGESGVGKYNVANLFSWMFQN